MSTIRVKVRILHTWGKMRVLSKLTSDNLRICVQITNTQGND